jgi:hypothetical protein
MRVVGLLGVSRWGRRLHFGGSMTLQEIRTVIYDPFSRAHSTLESLL